LGQLLSVNDLHIEIQSARGPMHVVRGVSFGISRGEILGIVGESGSGKSITCSSLLGLLPRPNGRIIRGSIVFDDQDVTLATDRQWRELRGRRISMIPQDPLGALNPVTKIGRQVMEAVRSTGDGSRKARQSTAIELLKKMRLPDAEMQMQRWPHQLSGGMRQRVVGAIAMSSEPDLIIADEATTALDSTIQLQYLDLLKDLRDRRGAAVIVITHDFGVVARLCDRVAVMYAGCIVEEGPVAQVLRSPRHPYTRALLASVPSLEALPDRLVSIEGQPPSPFDVFEGCAFLPRCPVGDAQCALAPPLRIEVGEGQAASCWRVGS